MESISLTTIIRSGIIEWLRGPLLILCDLKVDDVVMLLETGGAELASPSLLVNVLLGLIKHF